MTAEMFRWIQIVASAGLAMIAIGGILGLRSDKTRVSRQFLLAFTVTCAIGCPLFLLEGLGVMGPGIATRILLPFTIWWVYAYWKQSFRKDLAPQRPLPHPALAWTLIVLLFVLVVPVVVALSMKHPGWRSSISIAAGVIMVATVARILTVGVKKSSDKDPQK